MNTTPYSEDIFAWSRMVEPYWQTRDALVEAAGPYGAPAETLHEPESKLVDAARALLGFVSLDPTACREKMHVADDLAALALELGMPRLAHVAPLIAATGLPYWSEDLAPQPIPEASFPPAVTVWRVVNVIESFRGGVGPLKLAETLGHADDQLRSTVPTSRKDLADLVRVTAQIGLYGLMQSAARLDDEVRLEKLMMWQSEIRTMAFADLLSVSHAFATSAHLAYQAGVTLDRRKAMVLLVLDCAPAIARSTLLDGRAHLSRVLEDA